MVIPLILQLDMQVEKNKKCFKTTVKEVSGMIDLNIFILVSLVVGMTFGFHNAYRAVFATELQASKTLIGETANDHRSPKLTTLLDVKLAIMN